MRGYESSRQGYQDLRGEFQQATGGGNGGVSRHHAGTQRSGTLQRRRDTGLHPGIGARQRRLCGAEHLKPCQPQPDGAAHHDGRFPARVGRAHHSRHSVLRLRPAGSEIPRAGPHYGQAGGGPDRNGGSRPRADHGPARVADPGLFRRTGGPYVRRAHSDALFRTQNGALP